MGFLVRKFVQLVLAALLVLALGFVLFAQSLATRKPAAPDAADGIVALTGGAARIDDAMGLLARKKGRRLLISGVNAAVTRDTLRAQTAAHGRLFDCCVDIGREARDTIGNARETADWAQRHNFRSLIVVTSSYHIPRALAELRHTLGETELIEHPVVVDPSGLERWWRSPEMVRLLAVEYLKYLLTLARIWLIEPYLPSLLDGLRNGQAGTGGE